MADGETARMAWRTMRTTMTMMALRARRTRGRTPQGHGVPGYPFAHWAKLGAEQGVAFALENSAVNKINNYSWLKEYFRKINGR